MGRIPNDIVVVDQIPYGPSGKVELEKLRSLLDAGFSQSSGGNVRQGVFEEAVGAFGCAIDDLNEGSNPDNVAGWDSLRFLEFIMRLERRFDFRLDPREIMMVNNLGDLIQVVEDKRPRAE